MINLLLPLAVPTLGPALVYLAAVLPTRLAFGWWL